MRVKCFSLIITLLVLFASNCKGQSNTTTEASTTAGVDCSSYIYVAWTYFVILVGSGLQTSQYTTALFNVYSEIPRRCGGYDTSSTPEEPTTLLLKLLLNSNSYFSQTTTTTQSSIFNFFSQGFPGNLFGARSGRRPPSYQNLKSIGAAAFKRGKKILQKSRSYAKYIKNMKSPFGKKKILLNRRYKKKKQWVPCKKQTTEKIRMCRVIRVRRYKKKSQIKQKKILKTGRK